MGGRGIGQYTKGEQVTNLDQVKPGDVLVEYSQQFDALNLIKVTGYDHTPLERRMFTWVFINPETGRPFTEVGLGDRGAVMWEWEFAEPRGGMTVLLWKAVEPQRAKGKGRG